MNDMASGEDIFFEIETPLGFRVRTTVSYWSLIISIKHPIMNGKEEDVKATLNMPDEVRISKSDGSVYLFYRSTGLQRWVCAVAKQINGKGFLITAYQTSGIKEGTRIWPK